MKRRHFMTRLAKAATAFVVTPTAFRCLPAAANVREAVAAPKKLVPFWIQTRKGQAFVSPEYRKVMESMMVNGQGVNMSAFIPNEKPLGRWKIIESKAPIISAIQGGIGL